MSQMPLAVTTRRPSKPPQRLEELSHALEGLLGRPPGKSIHHGHPAASHRLRLEEVAKPLEELPAAVIEEPISSSAEFYAYGALNLSGTQTSRSDLAAIDENAKTAPNGPLELRGAQ